MQFLEVGLSLVSDKDCPHNMSATVFDAFANLIGSKEPKLTGPIAKSDELWGVAIRLLINSQDKDREIEGALRFVRNTLAELDGDAMMDRICVHINSGQPRGNLRRADYFDRNNFAPFLELMLQILEKNQCGSMLVVHHVLWILDSILFEYGLERSEGPRHNVVAEYIEMQQSYVKMIEKLASMHAEKGIAKDATDLAHSIIENFLSN